MKSSLFIRSAILPLAVTLCTPLAAAEGPFNSSWDSLKKYQCPDWFRDAKFGIWAHWGPQSVPMQGDWYARNMYLQGQRQYEHHLKTYGHPSQHGYKDIIPMWKAEKWDPDRLMSLYQKAGAKYFVSMACHHDNFDLWNSKYHKWNAVHMGPKRDIVGEWRKAATKYGLRFGVSEHMAASFTWWQGSHGADKSGPKAGVPYDGSNPEFADLYHPAAAADDKGWYSTNPAWHAEWSRRIHDLIESYEPDLLYSDGGLPFGATGRQLVADFYNLSASRHGGKTDGVYNCKSIHGDSDNNQFVAETCVRDMERGVLGGIQPLPWQTDTSIGDWFYNEHWKYRPTSWTVHMLVDIVSKNGNLLLNVVQRPDGSLDPEVERQLEELGEWTSIHGEAIYGTRPWQTYGEGRVKANGGNFNENFSYSAGDIRFTTKGDKLYAIALGWPENGRLIVRSLAKIPDAGVNRIESVSLLGYDGRLEWTQTADGLEVSLPSAPVSKLTAALRITGTGLKAIPVGAEVISHNQKGIYQLPASAAELHGDTIRCENRTHGSNIGFWDRADDWVSWVVDFDRPGRYRVVVKAATIHPDARVRLEMSGQKLMASVGKPDGWDSFTDVSCGELVVDQKGRREIQVRCADPATWKPVNLAGLELKPAD